MGLCGGGGGWIFLGVQRSGAEGSVGGEGGAVAAHAVGFVFAHSGRPHVGHGAYPSWGLPRAGMPACAASMCATCPDSSQG